MLRKIRGIMLQEYYITKTSLETTADIFWFPAMSVIAIGFVNQFYTKISGTTNTHSLTTTYIFWEFFRATQYTVTLGIMWNIWSHNLTNMFISPLGMREYFGTKYITGLCVGGLLLLVNGLVAFIFFRMNLLSLGLFNILLYSINLSLFGWSLGIVFVGIIFNFGVRIQAITWGAIYLVQPLSAALFPVNILPPILRMIAYTLPPTYTFEAIRINLINKTPRIDLFVIGIAINLIYMILAIIIFNFLYNRSKKTGQFVNNDIS